MEIVKEMEEQSRKAEERDYLFTNGPKFYPLLSGSRPLNRAFPRISPAHLSPNLRPLLCLSGGIGSQFAIGSFPEERAGYGN